MNAYQAALVLTILPAAGNLIGALLAERFRASLRVLSLALHGAAGTVLGVVGVELLPQILQHAPGWAIALAFAAGGVLFLLIDLFSHQVRDLLTGEERLTGPLTLYIAILIDLLNDGVLLGAAANLTTGISLLLALGQLLENTPTGFATVSAFKRAGVARRWRLLAVLSSSIIMFLGTTAGYFALRNLPAVYTVILLALLSGLLTTLVVEEIIPEAHEDGDARLATLFFIGGFALFTLLAAYIH
jgi:zinc transporter, ZIP family